MGIDVNKYQGQSKWLRAQDLTDQDMDAAIVTITEVFEETFGARDGKPAEDKLCLRFKEFEKPLGMNVTNTKSVIGLYGDDTDAWEGKKIKLRVSTANMPGTGETVDCIRIAAPQAKKTNGQPAAAAPKPAPVADDSDPYADE